MRHLITRISCLLLLLALAVAANAQDTLKTPDSTLPDILKILPDSLRDVGMEDSVRKTLNMKDTLVSHQLNKIEQYVNQITSITSLLNRGFDTTEISEDLVKLEEGLMQAKEGVILSDAGNNLRNLVSSKVLLEGIAKRLDASEKQVQRYAESLNKMRAERATIGRDSLMLNVPADSILRLEYISRIVELSKRLKPLDSAMQMAIVQMGMLNNRLVKAKFMMADYLGEIDARIKDFSRKMFRKEYGYLWQPSVSKRSLSEIIAYSYDKNKIIFTFYFKNSWANRALNITLVTLIFLALYQARKKMRAKHETFVLQQAGVAAKFPLVTAFFIICMTSVFVYNNGPDIFLQYTWLLTVFTFSWLAYPDFNPTLKKLWWAFFPLFLLSEFDYSLLQGNREERYLILFLSLAGLSAATYGLLKVKKDQPGMQVLRVSIWLFIAQEATSVVCNLFGRYTVSKIMMAGGYLNLVAAYCLVWWVKIVSQAVYLLVEANRNNERLTPFFNFSRITDETRRILNVIAVGAWVIIFARNLNFYHMVVEATAEFLIKDRAIGNFEFTLSSILIFFLIIWLSSVIATFIAFMLGGDKGQVSNIKKTRFGNIIILVRLAVYTLGFLIAIAAAGIPVDKITIIIGALGVGIGFGLQNVVNNLVSGIILAFERPITVGDQIEVDGQIGKVKEIGIRSSKLATFDGSEVIIPNGDLISRHVINWTLSSNMRRVEIIVGVKYGSDLEQVQQILNHIIDQHDAITKIPKPLVLAHNFGDSSIDFRLLFWTDIDNWVQVKSDVINGIDKAFKANDIEIPFPQQDLHLKSIDGLAAALFKQTGQEPVKSKEDKSAEKAIEEEEEIGMAGEGGGKGEEEVV